MSTELTTEKRLKLPLLLLRYGVFIVMFFWTIDKFVDTEHAAAIFKTFYFMGGLSDTALYAIGAVELAIILGFVLGYQKLYTYGAVLALHGISTVASFGGYIKPFEGPNLLFFAAWPMLAACFTLFYLRDLDTLWTVGTVGKRTGKGDRRNVDRDTLYDPPKDTTKAA